MSDKEVVVVLLSDGMYVFGYGSEGADCIEVHEAIRFGDVVAEDGIHRVMQFIPFMKTTKIPLTNIKYWGPADEDGEKFYKEVVESIRMHKSGLVKGTEADLKHLDRLAGKVG